MKSQLKSTFVGAVAGPFIFLFISLCVSGLMQGLWSTPSWTIGRQIFNAVIWGALLGAVTFNVHFHYNHADFVRAKHICLLCGAILSFIFLAGLLYRLATVEIFIPPSVKAMPSYNPSKSRWLALAFFESVALHWSLALLLFGLWLPKRNQIQA
jgi:hypothetical protein